eukprot:3612258-Prymnesium_polylepis.1
MAHVSLSHSACSDRGDDRMTRAVAAWPPDRPGIVVVGKTIHVWYPRVSVAGPATPSCRVA